MKPLESYHNWNERALSMIADLKDCQQSKIHHAEGNVYIHTQMVISEIKRTWDFLSEDRKSILLFTGILHDIAKPITTVFEDGDWRSPRHAKVGENVTRELIWKDFTFEKREEICSLVRYHGLPLWFNEKENPDRAVIEASLRCNISELAYFSECDFRGRICKDLDECLFIIELFKEKAKELGCYDKPYNFVNDWSRLSYFKRDTYHGAEIYEPDGGEFTLMVGLPGSGKSTWANNNWASSVVELDEIRKRLKIKPTDKNGQGLVAQTAKEDLRIQFRKKENVLLNSTNITKNMRSTYIDLALQYGMKINIVYIDCSLEQALKQNKERENAIPDNVIEKLARKLEIPTLSECHNLTVLKNK